MSTRRRYAALALAGWVSLCVGVGASASLVTASSVRDWYPTIAKPTWTPPNGVFGPVWTVLYVAMGVAAWYVWQTRRSPERRVALVLFGVQLGLNAAWSVIFFGLRAPGPAAVEIVLLWVAIAATIVAFRRIRPIAAALLVPYLAWVSFAAALNVAIWRLAG